MVAKSEERKHLELRKLTLESQIRALKVSKRRGEFTSRVTVTAKVARVFNELRSRIEGFPESLAVQLNPVIANEYRMRWNKALRELLEGLASRAGPRTGGGDNAR